MKVARINSLCSSCFWLINTHVVTILLIVRNVDAFVSSNLQACPDNYDFRDYQCSKYNEFGEIEKTWKAYHHPEETCSLYCIDQRDNVKLMADRVHDGTRCRPGSLDMCIDGACQVRHVRAYYFKGEKVQWGRKETTRKTMKNECS